ncbi:N-acetylglucosamine-6-phosphate deacetylase [Plantactinospora mayteni]|uniref:N-acetylglucosamine-6-phosphate deacetylase n=1 Tax=Plantactinospora mayteni TaxID=566021 RepID=A0ABQ4ERF4_9ACTN|nr:N-acetylglucosamine-6-phosphate deacetylase [Plantactinospora mayteni]
MQVNGYQGYDLNSDEVDADVVTNLVEVKRQHGVTAFCPTLITAEEGKLVSALAVIRKVRAADPDMATAMPCVHVEGPHISPAPGARGAHDPDLMRPPSTAEFDRWQAASGGIVGIVTIAPELPGAVRYTRELAGRGVIVSLGHCDATAEQISAAVDAGARLSTHLGNGAAQLLPRHPNHLWAQLADDRLSASFIADGHHLPADTFTVMTRAKGVEHSILVSDSAALAGLPPGDYETPVGGRVTVDEVGRLVLTGSNLLAGSGRSLLHCLAWVVRHTEVGLAPAVQMASSNPARLLGLAGRHGLVPGAPADLVVAHEDSAGAITVQRTLVAGRTVYQS